ncbi:MAG: FAD-dependent oxidoreductase [Oscillospiraceae bacterium]|jgi:NADPH-dependent 2,4-dienoyl-CoA reductase/sulfur reductase-like enzyme/rhodanese-related sulfurtransferase|nr:FAD-dependent oxidoreductase [Oscillospiraceae bacterium]
MSKKIVIIGGVAGGATAAARIRRLDENAEITIFEQGDYVSFANCGLPYFVGGEIAAKQDLLLQTPRGFKIRYNIDVNTGCKVTEINRAAKTVMVENIATGETFAQSYDKLLLAPGAESIIPESFDKSGLTDDANLKIATLQTVDAAEALKEFANESGAKTAVIAGGGAIGLELAESLRKKGINVHVAEMAQQILPHFDEDMARFAQKHLHSCGVTLHLGAGVVAAYDDPAGGNRAKVRLGNGEEIAADILVFAVGVKPRSSLALDCGLECNARGAIVTDSGMKTSDNDIFAVGDAVETFDFATGEHRTFALAGPANKQARIAADNICAALNKTNTATLGTNAFEAEQVQTDILENNLKYAAEYAGAQGSSIVRVFGLAAASTGMNEKTARSSGLNYEKVFLLAQSHAGYYPGGNSIVVKVLFSLDDGKILGAQLFGGEGTDKRCDVLATAIRMGATATDLTQLDLCYAPPYSSAKDPVNMVGYIAENILTGKVKQFHWHEVAALPQNGTVQKLDVRTTGEFLHGNIPRFTNIPLDELRGRLGELEKSKPVYVHCHSGQRSYLACRILTQNGFDCYNLSGGWFLYNNM